MDTEKDVDCDSENYYRHMHPYDLTLLGLPDELLIRILLQVEWRSVVTCTGVCLSLRNLIQQSAVLKYHIELGADGLVDSSLSNLPISDRLSLLLTRRESWRELDWKKRDLLLAEGECTAYELVGGVFAKAMPSEDFPRDFFDPGLGAYGFNYFNHGRQESRRLSLMSLPSATRKEGVAKLEHEDIGLDCRDFAIDPSQDLIALVESLVVESENDDIPYKYQVSIHLRTISANAAHPCAQTLILTHMLPFAFDGAIVQICDDVLALCLLVHSVPRVLIWQWTTGILLVREMDILAFRFVDDFTLISARAFMVTSHFPVGSIKLYPFEAPSDCYPHPTSPCPAIDACVRNRISTTEHLYPCKSVSLTFPTLASNNVYSEITSHTAPFSSGTRAGKPYSTSEDVRVHIMSVATEPQRTVVTGNLSEVADRSILDLRGGAVTRGKAGNYTVIVTNRVFLTYVEMVRSLVMKQEVEIPWEEWGPRNTRWLAERHNYAWLSPFIYPSTGIRRFVHGSRFVRAKVAPWPAPRASCRLQVLDFNVHPKRHEPKNEISSINSDDSNEDLHRRPVQRIVVDPTEIHEPAVFRSDVVSCLPYHEVTSCEEFPYTGFMIDEERIIGLSAPAFSLNDMKHIEVFSFY